MLIFVTTVNIFKMRLLVSKAREIIIIIILFLQRAGIVAALNTPPLTWKDFFGSCMFVKCSCLQWVSNSLWEMFVLLVCSFSNCLHFPVADKEPTSTGVLQESCSYRGVSSHSQSAVRAVCSWLLTLFTNPCFNSDDASGIAGYWKWPMLVC